MPNNTSLKTNQTQAHIHAGMGPQGTHQAASQASAARFIEVLREAYPEIAMETRLNDTAQSSETTIASKISVQIQLKTILQQQVALLSSAEPEIQENGLDDLAIDVQSPIHGTLKMITHIHALTNYSIQARRQVLLQMIDIAGVCPGLQWNTNDKHWCSNTIYDLAIDKVRFVIASPAETLNLVCRGLLDPARYPHQIDDEENTTQDQQHRIDSFFQCLLSLYQLQHNPQRKKCAGGIQHDLLNLLSHSYHDKSCSYPDSKPIEWINDTTTFIFEKLTAYVTERLKTSSCEDIIFDWVKFQQRPSTDASDEIHPLISFLRTAFVVEGDEPDTAWKENCEIYLSSQCIAIGLCPSMCPLNEIIEAITSLQPPALEGGLTTMMIQLMAAQSIEVSEHDRFSSVIKLRNQSILSFQTSMDKTQWPLLKQTVAHLFSAEEVFQLLFQHRQLTLFIDDINNATKLAFKRANISLDANLTIFYSAPLLQTFNMQPVIQSKREYLQQLNNYKKDYLDYIESYFKRVNQAYEPGADPSLRELDMIPDEALNHWLSLQKSTQNCFDLTQMCVYEVNRLLLQGLSVPSSLWSPTFRIIISKLVSSLASVETKSNSKIEELKRSIPHCLLDNLALVACIQQSDEEVIKQHLSYSADNEAIKNMLSSTLITTFKNLEKTQFETIFNFLLKRQAEIFISDFQLVACLTLNLSNNQQHQLMKVIPRKIYEHTKGIVNLFRLPNNQLSHVERERILILMKDQLKEVISPIFIPLFSLPETHLSQLERNLLFNPESKEPGFIPYDFNTIILQHSQLIALFSLSTEQLSVRQRDAILGSLELTLYFSDFDKIYSFFKLDITQLSEANRNTIFLKIQHKFAQMPTDGLPNLFSLSLKQLAPFQWNMIIESCEENIYHSVQTADQLIQFLSFPDDLFPERLKRKLVTAKKHDLKKLIKKASHVSDLMRLSHGYFSLNEIWDAISDIFTTPDFDSGLHYLFTVPLELFTEEKRKDFCLQLAAGNTPFLETTEQFLHLFNLSLDAFSAENRAVIFKALQANFRQFIYPPFKPDQALIENAKLMQIPENDLSFYYCDVNSINLCLLLELPVDLLSLDCRAFICDTFIESYIKETVREIINIKSKINQYASLDGSNEEKSRLMKKESLLFRRMTHFFTAELNVRLLSLSEQQITKGAREQLVQFFFKSFTSPTQVSCMRNIYKFLDLSLLQFTEEQRHKLVHLTIETQKTLLSDIDNLFELFRLPVEKLSYSLRQDILKNSHFSCSMERDNLLKLSSLFELSIECLSVESRVFILSRIFDQNPHLAQPSNPCQLVSILRDMLLSSGVPVKQRILYWNSIRPLSGNDFPKIPGGETCLGNAILAQDFQAALDCVFNGQQLEKSICFDDAGEMVDGMTYLRQSIACDAIAAPLRRELTIFTNNLILSEKLMLLKQKVVKSCPKKLPWKGHFFQSNRTLEKYMFDNIVDMQHLMMQEPLQEHPEIQTFIQHCSESHIEPLPITQSNPIEAPMYTFFPYNASFFNILSLSDRQKALQTYYENNNAVSLKVKMKGFEMTANSPCDLACAIGAQLMLSLIHIRCLGGGVFGYIRPENIMITEDASVLIDANLVFKHSDESCLNSDAVLMNRIGMIIYTIACRKSLETVHEVNLGPENIKNESLRLFLQKVLNNDLAPVNIFELFFSFPCESFSSPELQRRFNALREKMNNFEGDERALTKKKAIEACLLLLFSPLKDTLKDALKNTLNALSCPPPTWFNIEKNIAPSVLLVTITAEEEFKQRKNEISAMVEKNLPRPRYYVIKRVKFSGDASKPQQDHAVRWAVTIMEKSHHPNIIRMLSAKIQMETLQILMINCEVGSLSHVVSNYPKEQVNSREYIQFLLAVTCQVLNGLLFLQEKLKVAHRATTPDHILLSSNGQVKLCGFDARGTFSGSSPCDTKQLSITMLKLMPIKCANEAEYIKDARAFAERLALVQDQPARALSDVMMKPYYDAEDNCPESIKLKIELQALTIVGTTPADEMISWRTYDQKNPTANERLKIRQKIQELTLIRMDRAIAIVKERVKSIPLYSDLLNSPSNEATSSPAPK